MHEVDAMEFDIDITHGGTRALDFLALDKGSMRKIYCKCGRIVDIDSGYFRVRRILGKDIECSFCRNERVGREIDELNNHFLGISEDDTGASDLL